MTPRVLGRLKIRHQLFVLGAVLAGALLIPDGARAQEAESSALQSIWEQADRGHWYVRVITSGDTLQGRVRYVRGRASIGGLNVSPPLRIDRRHERGGGMLIGAAAGFLVGAVLAGGMAGNSEGRADVLPAVIGGGGFGMVVGLFAGNVAAPGRIQWRTVWPNDQ